MTTFLSLLPLFVVIALGWALVTWFRRRPKPVAEPLVLEPIPDYSGPLAFFKKHYNGDYSLGRSYWVHTFLISWFALGAGVLVTGWLGEHFPARYGSMAALLTMAGVLGLWVWAIAGTWASAGKHVRRGGKAAWANLAKVAIVLGAIRTVGDVSLQVPALAEHFKVASGWQAGPETQVELLPDGKTLRLSGGINDGSAAQLRAALKMAPSVTTLVLESPGGWIREGDLIATIVRERGLDTYVERLCASACTMAFLAGRDRAADPGARIGFHSVKYVGSGEGLTEEEAAATRQAYAKAGLPADFVLRISQTPADSMWCPDHAELVRARVLTRRSLGGETAALAGSLRSQEDLDRELRKVGAFQALASKYPQDYARVLEVAWQQLSQGRSDAQVLSAARAELGERLQQLLPLARDETLVAYNAVMLEQLDLAMKAGPEFCIELLYPSQPANVVSLFPSELVRRELELTRRVFDEADPARALGKSPAAEAYFERLAVEIPQDELVAMGSAEARQANPAAACRGIIRMFTKIGQLPSPAREQALRYAYGQ